MLPALQLQELGLRRRQLQLRLLCRRMRSLSYCDLELPAAGWSGNGISPDTAFCAAPTPTFDNQGIGQACTPPSDGSVGAGSCGSGQVCQTLGSGPVCTQDCSQSPCPGSSWCAQVQVGAGKPNNSAWPPAQPPRMPAAAGVLACAPITPNAADPGYCQVACASSSDCNAAGATTALTCSDGVCKCTANGDSPEAQTCDTASGACYIACGPSVNIGCGSKQGCCAQEGSVGYCDPMGSGSPTGFQVGPHTGWPQVQNTDGNPVLANPDLVTVTFNPWKDKNGVQSATPSRMRWRRTMHGLSPPRG